MKIWPFNRKQNTDDLPGEVKEFYESGKRERSGMAWLLALATLVVTVILAVALFYGGRWLYQKIAGNDDSGSQQTLQTESDDNRQTPPSSGPTDDSDDSDGDQRDSSSASTDEPSAATDDSDEADLDQDASVSEGGSEVPNTGPGPGGLQ